MLSRERGDEGGFSLVELLVVMAIGSVVMAAVIGTAIALTRASTFAVDETYTQDVNRVGMERVTRFLRQGTYPEGKTPSNSTIFEKATAYDVVFFADVDDDGEVDRVRFRLVGDGVEQTVMGCNPPGCTYETFAAGARTTPIASVHNDDLDTAVCPGFTVDEPIFRYFERSAGGSLTALTAPVSPALYGRIASIEVSLVVDITEGGDAACQELSALIHLRNWRG